MEHFSERVGIDVGIWGEYRASAFEDLTPETVPRHHPLTIYGRVITPLRHTQFYTDSGGKGGGYSYSSGVAEKAPLLEWMKKLVKEVNAKKGTTFDSILVNVYPTGSSYISAHSDSDIRDESGVYAISYGATRVMRFRAKENKEKIADIPLKDGDGLHMKGIAFQNDYTHEIPKIAESKCSQTRISLTFRNLAAAG